MSDGAKRRSCSSQASNDSSSGGSAALATIEPTLKQQERLRLSHQKEQPTPLGCFLNALLRKKPLDCRTDTNLNRCLNLVDLTALGVGSTLGLGLYVLAGQVASNKAGPGVVISFALAALASAFSALCYAEFAGRVPRAGSAYAYSYITVGEFVAFVIGWNLILEYVIGASSVARGFSGYLRFVVEHVAINLGLMASSQPQTPPPSATNATQLPANLSAPHQAALTGALTSAALIDAQASRSLLDSIASYLVEYFDWPSVAIITLLTIFILIGVKESTNVTFVFTALNLFVVSVVVISSLGSLDTKNWRLAKSEVPVGFGEGGFLPYGWAGVLAGSATCFFGFIGFDTIASSAEEAKNPKRNVPLSIVTSLFISFVAYMAIAIVQTLLWPYYDQNNVTILPYIFNKLQMPLTYWVVLVGAIAGLASSQLGGMYPLPRILYSMAHDKLIYGWLAKINSRLKLPVRATIVGSIFVAALACLLDIQDLADMVSIGTLAAYSLVSLSVLILRYEDRSDAVDDSTIINNHLTFTDILSTIELSTIPGSNLQQQEQRDEHTQQISEQPTTNGSSGRPKLAPKASIPIREKGSKTVTAQLSVGFQSWFKPKHSEENSSLPDIAEGNATNKGNSHANHAPLPSAMSNNIPKKQNYLDLLITWKASDQLQRQQAPTNESSRQSKILISILVILSVVLDIIALCLTTAATPTTNLSSDSINNSNYNPLEAVASATTTTSEQPRTIRLLLYSSGCIIFVLLATVMLMLSRLPTSQSVPNDVFQVPFVPLIPILSIFVNTFLMLNLSYLTWVRFSVWMALGLFIYFTYGIWNSEGYLLYLDR